MRVGPHEAEDAARGAESLRASCAAMPVAFSAVAKVRAFADHLAGTLLGDRRAA